MPPFSTRASVEYSEKPNHPNVAVLVARFHCLVIFALDVPSGLCSTYFQLIADGFNVKVSIGKPSAPIEVVTDEIIVFFSTNV